MTHTFGTKQEAIDAGYVPARVRRISKVGQNGEIRIVDTTASPSFGYVYGIAAFREDAQYGGSVRVGDIFVQSVTVWLTEERNRIGQPGAFTSMFTPEDYERGVRSARQFLERHQ